MVRPDEIRLRILDSTLELLRRGGRDAVTTRAVTTASRVQAPTLYRIFGDKQGLLDAVAAYGFETHLSEWHGVPPGTEVLDVIRDGWDMHVRWGLENPQLYAIAYGDARPGVSSPAADAIDGILRVLIEQLAATGRLKVPVRDAVSMFRAIGSGVVFTLIAMPEDARDPRLSERGRESTLSAVLAEPTTDEGRSGTAMRLRAELENATTLSTNERALLGDWLDRLARE